MVLREEGEKAGSVHKYSSIATFETNYNIIFGREASTTGNEKISSNCEKKETNLWLLRLFFYNVNDCTQIYR